MTSIGPINKGVGQRHCAAWIDPFHLISNFKINIINNNNKTIGFVTWNTLKYCDKVILLISKFSGYHCKI